MRLVDSHHAQALSILIASLDFVMVSAVFCRGCAKVIFLLRTNSHSSVRTTELCSDLMRGTLCAASSGVMYTSSKSPRHAAGATVASRCPLPK